jgi:anti-sigma factor RsiW
MSETTPPIGDNDLHAFVDGRLDAARRRKVERYLSTNPKAATRVAAYQAQREAIRAAFAPGAAEPPPPHLSLSSVIARRDRRPRTPWLVAASVLLALAVGTAGGWLSHDLPGPGQTRRALERDVFASHVVYAADAEHPVEVAADDAPRLLAWLSHRLERTIVAPDLSTFGYHLIGGRLLATERGHPAALLMYDDTKQHRISLLLRPITSETYAPWRITQRNGVNLCTWIDDGLGFAVAAEIPESELVPLTTRIGSDFEAHA